MKASKGCDPYEYVRRFYNVPAYVGVPITISRGTLEPIEAVIVRPRSATTQYLVVKGPWPRRVIVHPADGVTYRPQGCPEVVKK